MSSQEQLSGIVYYPQSLEMSLAGANLARQLGMAVGSTVVGGELVLGTAHAIGYNPATMDGLAGLYSVADQSATLILDYAGEEELFLGELEDAARTHLEELGLVGNGVANVLDGRRVDVIAPPEWAAALAVATKGWSWLDHGSGILQKAHVWVERGIGEAGIFVESPPQARCNFLPEHPLREGIDYIPFNTHTVMTTKATGVPVVVESAAVTRPPSHVTRQRGQGYFSQVTSTPTDVHSVYYELPHTPRGDRVNQMQQDRNRVPHDAYEGDEMVLDYVRDSQNAAAKDAQHTAAADLDPLENAAWAAGLR